MARRSRRKRGAMIAIQLDVAGMTMGVLGGLAVFLLGMERMTGALKAAAGGRLREWLARLTKGRVRAVATGGLMTAVIQSSSITVVLAIGFVSAGLLSVQQAIGVVLGAEIGTTITAQVIAFPISKYALGVVALGFALRLLSKSERVKRYGQMVLGLGLIFLGMDLMRLAVAPLRDDPAILDLLTGQGPGVAILVGAVFTAIVQSSSATTAIVIVLGGEGLIPLETAIGVVFGANIGTCVTGTLAAIGQPRVALRVSVAQLLFNVLGVCIWLPLISLLAQMVEGLAEDVPRQIAHAHTLTNVTNTLLVLPVMGWFTRLVTRLVPDRAHDAGPVRPKYLDAQLIGTPALALDRARLETERAGRRALAMVRRIPEAVMAGDEQELDAIEAMDESVDVLHKAIIDYLGRVGRGQLTEREAQRYNDAVAVAGLVENIADVCAKPLVRVGRRRLRKGVQISPSTRAVFGPLVDEVAREAERLASPHVGEKAGPSDVIAAQEHVSDLADAVRRQLAARLTVDEPFRQEAHRIEIDLLENLQHIYNLTRSIARILASRADDTDDE